MSAMDESAAGTRVGTVAGLSSQDDQLVRVNDHLWVSRDVSDSILVTTPAGDVVVNTGMPGNGGRHRERFDTVSTASLKYIIITQCHGDHFGGAEALREPVTQVITQERFPELREGWRILHDFYTRRSAKLWGPVLGERADVKDKIEEVTPDITFRDTYTIELGGRHFELLAAPGGESEDGVVVWLPPERIAVTGNLFGPVFGTMPNLYTIRGDRIRSALRFVESLDSVAALDPETIVTGHEVINGADEIRAALDRVREAVQYVHQYTIDGMNAGTDVRTLMREIRLPQALRIGQAHGKFSWCVRAIWEEYAGWFHYDSTTSLYGVPASSVAGNLVKLAGGADALASRAEHHLAQKRPLHALHLLDIALHAEPDNPAGLQAKIAAHQQLLELSGGENFSEVMWLKSEIKAAQDRLQPG